MIKLMVNGVERPFDGDPSMPLLWFIRDIAGLTGTKFGCGLAQCGACTVHVDGAPQCSCVTPVSAAAGKSITTIEGLSADGSHPVQRAVGRGRRPVPGGEGHFRGRLAAGRYSPGHACASRP